MDDTYEKRHLKRRSDAYLRKCERRLMRGWLVYFLVLLIALGYGLYNTLREIGAEEYRATLETTTFEPKITSEETTETATLHMVQASISAITTVETTTITETTTVDNDTYLLAQLIDAEAGDECTDEHKLWVGQVAVNRVKHPQFPNNLKEVIYQKGQYHCVDIGAINNIPSKRSLQAAKSILNGFTMDKDVIWQSEFPQGEVVEVLETGYSTTYIGK